MKARQAILILAAGASARMGGRDKLLEPIGGMPLLAGRIAAALSTGAPVYVALPPRAVAPRRWALLEGSGARAVEIPDAGKGMGASLAGGVSALPADIEAVLILLADMPEITGADMRALLDVFDGETILRGAGSDGTPGHPVLIPRRDFPALAGLSGDQGAREILQAEKARVHLVRLPGRHALTDLDTEEDWARWRPQ